MIPACRTVLLLVSIGSLLLSLSAAPGCRNRCYGTGEKAAVADNTAETGRTGVTVTKEVPHSKETVPETRDREVTDPLPARKDKAIHSHEIPRAGTDNGARTE